MATTSATKPISKSKTATKAKTKTTTAKTPVKTRTKATTAETTKSASTAKTEAKKTAPRKPPVDTRERGPHGYALGTDSAIIAESLIEGGASRDECNARATERIEKGSGLTTRGGQPKYIPSMSATIIKHLVNSGMYRVEESYKLVPVKPYDGASKTSATVKKAPVQKKAPAKKPVAKKPTTRTRKPAAAK